MGVLEAVVRQFGLGGQVGVLGGLAMLHLHLRREGGGGGGGDDGTGGRRSQDLASLEAVENAVLARLSCHGDMPGEQARDVRDVLRSDVVQVADGRALALVTVVEQRRRRRRRARVLILLLRLIARCGSGGGD